MMNSEGCVHSLCIAGATPPARQQGTREQLVIVKHRRHLTIDVWNLLRKMVINLISIVFKQCRFYHHSA